MRPRSAILLAIAIVYVVANWIPFGGTALYPLTLFTTWVHEMGHGLTALMMGGSFEYLEINRNAGGLAHCGAASGWPEAMVGAGGLLAPPILGAAIIAFVHGPRRARILLAALAGALVLSVIIYVRSAAGVIAMPIVAAALGWSAWRGFAENPERRVVLAQILGVILALDTLTRMVSYAFTTSVTVDGKPSASDIQIITNEIGGSHILWGMAITGIAVGLLVVASWWAWRRPVRAPHARDLPTSAPPRPPR
ncbi:MAG: M50 family metallopeptidase [Deltaproteobacteria bacterium]|nr:M50 family metallopeptidase [Deltaproteobacteria bacterium]